MSNLYTVRIVRRHPADHGFGFIWLYYGEETSNPAAASYRVGLALLPLIPRIRVHTDAGSQFHRAKTRQINLKTALLIMIYGAFAGTASGYSVPTIVTRPF